MTKIENKTLSKSTQPELCPYSYQEEHDQGPKLLLVQFAVNYPGTIEEEKFSVKRSFLSPGAQKGGC